MKTFFTSLLLFFLLAPTASAQFSNRLTDNAAVPVYGTASGQDFFVFFGRLLQIIFSILGVILLLYILAGGIYWMTAGGNEEQVKKAKNMLRNSVIGIIIILAALAVATFVTDLLANAGLGNSPVIPNE